MPGQWVDINRVMDFVDRTTGHGVPLRVATARASRRFGVDRRTIYSFVTARSARKGLS